MSKNTTMSLIVGAFVFGLPIVATAQSPQASDRAKEVAAIKAFWTSKRISSAQPRDLVVDHRGLGYLRGKGGKLIPYGHSNPALPEPQAPGGNGGGKGGGGNVGGRPGGGDTGDTGFENVKNAQWPHDESTVQTAAGRILFVMGGDYYVCSGTLINDGNPGNDRSIVLTAAHCVYDDLNKAFAESATFIPNQAGTTGSGTDLDCSNDPYSCWVADFGVVSDAWSAAEWPANIPSDYGYYALGTNTEYVSSDGQDKSLDQVLVPMDVSFATVDLNIYTRALGYSYSDDPNFMYCGEPVTGSSYDGLLLPNCALSGGASGGPWSQNEIADLGAGPVISVNSYGPSRGKKYMGGPRLDNNDAECLFDSAKSAQPGSTTNIVPTCP